MNIEEAIFDIIEIKKAISDDSDLDEMFLIQKLNTYRELFINQQYQLTHHLDYSWLQRHPQFRWEKVTAADDPNIVNSSITLGKFKLPSIVSLPDDMGLYQVTGSGAITLYTKDDFPTMMMRAAIREVRYPKHGYYSRVGNVLYSFPYEMYGQAIVIAQNPMDIPIIENNVQRDFTIVDEYPASSAIIQQAILQILTSDLKIMDSQINDIINDSQTQLKLLSNAPQQAQRSK